MSRYITAIFFSFVAVGLISSCSVFRRSERKVVAKDSVFVAPPDTAASLPSVISDEKQALIEALMPLWQRELQYTTFSGKAKMHYEHGNEKQDFTAHFRIKKDEMIWVSVTALGGIVQVARLSITPDSFRLINYMEKQVTLLPVSDAVKVLPVPADFSMLQNLIVGNILRTAGRATDATDFGGSLSMEWADDFLVQQVTFNKADSTIRSLQMKMASANGPAGMIQYGRYEEVNRQKFSSSRSINVVNGSDHYYLDMNFGNVELNKELDFPFSIPKNYTVK